MLCNRYLAVLLLLSATAAASAAAPPPATAAASHATTPTMDDWQETSQALRLLLPPPRDLTSQAARNRVAPAAIPLLHKGMALCREMSQSSPDQRSAALQHYYHMLAIAAFLGDHPSIIELDNARRAGRPETAAFARHAWYLTRWWPRLNRPADAARILDELQTLAAAAAPADDDLASLLLQMREDLPPNSPLRPQIETLITTHLQGPLAQRAINQFGFAEKRRSLLGKPLLLTAPTVAGEPFSSRSLAGQTILLHFGQTTSAKWQQQHNALLQLADDLPNKVAIVTILCDESETAVKGYLAQHKQIPWTVVRDTDDPSGFALQYGVEDFPATIIIGPKGTVLAVDVTPDAELVESLGTSPTSQP